MEAADGILRAITAAERVLLTGPVAPDGDSLGACLALRVLALRKLGAASEGKIVVAGRVPARYGALPRIHTVVADEALEGSFDAVIVLDGDRHRLTPEAAHHFHGAAVKGLIDHHGSSRTDGYTHVWLEPQSESTCGMLFRAAAHWQIPLDPELAALLYAGVVFDTGAFRHSNTGPATHRMAAELLATGLDHAPITARILLERSPAGVRAMGAILSGVDWSACGRAAYGQVPLALQRSLGLREGDLEGVVDTLLHAEGTEVAALIIERADGKVKVSLRSRGDTDVSAVASALAPTGGGHPRASGAVFTTALPDAARAVRHALESALPARPPSHGRPQ